MTNVEYYFNLCRDNDFPYPNYVDDYLYNQYEKLMKINCSQLKNINICLPIIYQFHRSIWNCNKKNYLSPLSGWYDDKILLKCIENRLKYKGDKLSLDNIRDGLTIAQLAPKISIFRPYLAKYLVRKYLNEFDVVFDPCAGYSGRMLGVCSLGKKYIGQDINETTICESFLLKQFLNLNQAELSIKNSVCDEGEYECLFTCPPYSDKETWGDIPDILTADEWIDVCLKNYKCKKYLFIVDKTEKYKDNIVEKISNKSHFSNNCEYVILINRTLNE